MSNDSRHLDVIFCDDLRQEVGNKLSYMGVYTGELRVPNATVILPKLFVIAKATTDIDDPFESLELRLFRVIGDEETELLSSGPIPLPTDVPRQNGDSNGGPGRLMLQMHFLLAPLQIIEEFKLRVKAYTERGEISGASALRVRIVPPQIDTPELVPIQAVPAMH